MPVVYASGSPDANGHLGGIEITSPSQVISEIRDVLVQAGHSVDESEIANNKIVSEGDDNGDKCHFIWEVTEVNPSEQTLIVTGDLNGDGASLSQPQELPIFPNSQPVLYLSTDEAGGCICIANGSLSTSSLHFGFPNRTTDIAGTWFLGKLDQWLDSCQIAQDPYDNVWLNIHKYFYSGTESRTSPAVGGYHLLWDSMVIAVTSNSNFTSHTSSGSANNAAHEPWRGGVDSITGKPVLGGYGYLIGQLPFNSYVAPGVDTPAQRAVSLHNPGLIRFARTGVASLAPGQQYQNNNGSIIMSGGESGEFQGFLISAPTG